MSKIQGKKSKRENHLLENQILLAVDRYSLDVHLFCICFGLDTPRNWRNGSVATVTTSTRRQEQFRPINKASRHERTSPNYPISTRGCPAPPGVLFLSGDASTDLRSPSEAPDR